MSPAREATSTRARRTTLEIVGPLIPEMSKFLDIASDWVETRKHCLPIFKVVSTPCGRSYPKLTRENTSSMWRRFARFSPSCKRASSRTPKADPLPARHVSAPDGISAPAGNTPNASHPRRFRPIGRRLRPIGARVDAAGVVRDYFRVGRGRYHSRDSRIGIVALHRSSAAFVSRPDQCTDAKARRQQAREAPAP